MRRDAFEPFSHALAVGAGSGLLPAAGSGLLAGGAGGAGGGRGAIAVGVPPR